MNNMRRVQNNVNPRTGGNGSKSGESLSGRLEDQIRALSFVKAELELYLDTHPGCKTAIDYYHRTVEALDALIEEYENTVGPITARGVVSDDEWTWTNSPWPWHNGTNTNTRAKGEGR